MTVGPAWVAASVRGRAIAARRVGSARCEVLAEENTLEGALDRLADTTYGPRLEGVRTLAAAQRAVTGTVLWRLRVLAGWMPVSGASLARAAAAAFELQNIVDHAQRLRSGRSPAPLQTVPLDTVPLDTVPLDTGTLETAWSRVRETSSMDELDGVLRRSGWGDPGHPEHPGALRDVLTMSWLRRLAAVAPEARPWAAAACALLAARIDLVDPETPAERLVALARPFIGTAWTTARRPADLVSALPRSMRPVLAGIDEPAQLWRAEARLGTVVERDGLRLIAGSAPGPDTVLGVFAVIAVDAWRVRAALAAAAAGTGASAAGLEVRHAMA